MSTQQTSARPKRTYGTGEVTEHVTKAGAVMYHGRARMPDGSRPRFVLGRKRTAGYADGLTKTQAEAKLRELVQERQSQAAQHPTPRGKTIGAAAKDWLAHLDEQDRAATTIEDADSALEHHVLPFFGKDAALAAITFERCGAFVAYLRGYTSKRTGRPLTPKSIRNYAGVLSGLLGYAVARRWLPTNPIAGVVLPPPANDGDVIDHDDVMWADDAASLIASVLPGEYETLDGALYTLATMAGVRKGEALGLTWQHVDFEASRIRVFEQIARGNRRRRPKSGKGRSVPMAEQVREALLELRNVSPWTADDHPVFADPHTGHPIAWTPARTRYLAALVAAGLGRFTRFHDLRHTFASTLAQAGVEERKIQEWCGHATPAITRRYMHFAPAAAADVAAVSGAFGQRTNDRTNLSEVGMPENTSTELEAA
jgi:integrase